MNQRALVAAAAATLLTGLMSTLPAGAQQPQPKAEKERCYGIAKAGQNDCANLSGSHSCAGQAKTNDDPTEWKYVAKGTCKSMKGLTAEQAKAKAGKA